METTLSMAAITNFERLFGVSQIPVDGKIGSFEIKMPAYVSNSCAIPCQTHINWVFALLRTLMDNMNAVPATNYKATELYWYLYKMPNSNVIYNICSHWKPANRDYYNVLLAISREVIHAWKIEHPYKLVVKPSVRCKAHSTMTCRCRDSKLI